MNPPINLKSNRAAQARLAKAIGRPGSALLLGFGCAFALSAVLAAIVVNPRVSLFLVSPALLCFMGAIWWQRQLTALPVTGNTLSDRLSGDILARLDPRQTQTAETVWKALGDHWQSYFFTNHLLVSKDAVIPYLATDTATLDHALSIAQEVADAHKSPVIEVGFVVAGLLLASPQFLDFLKAVKSQASDVEALADWLARDLAESRREQQNFGGIGRDWAFGFTPLLDRFGQNVSLAIARNGAHFGWLTQSAGVLAIESAFDNHAAAIALVGPDGIGKTSSVYALAQRLIEGNSARSLAYHQVIALNAIDITSRTQRPGDLETIMLNIINEASHAGHIVLFFDNAQLFFGEGLGAFNAGQILLSIVEARAVQLIFAFSPSDYQRLRQSNPSLASLITPVVLQELPETAVMHVLEDTTAGLENRHNVLIAYEALREAYQLSGRYEHDEAYPGKAIKLLEQAISHGRGGVIDALSVQETIEQTRGVKVSTASAGEADALLHLEDSIHQRMINQTHAVSVVANALRRARAGVTNPKRPIGSFLFLGPTGVGKTELAKAVAATYFGAESNLLRLDMSEYQQPDDVQRLLSTGQGNNSLLLQIRQQPFSVVLLDEIEKAHPNVLNLLLQLLDEGQLTDMDGRKASFKDCIIIVTSNAGAQTIRGRISKGESLESFASELTDQLINDGQFKPELLNRFDELVLFRPLKPEELSQVVRLMIGEVNQTLTTQNISIELTDDAVKQIVATGNDPRLGARPMRRALQKAVENTIAQKILRGEAKPGDHVVLDVADLAS